MASPVATTSKSPTPEKQLIQESNGVHNASPGLSPVDYELPDDTDESKPTFNAEQEKQKAEDARKRYDEDMENHKYEPPPMSRVQDDWQVAYVWAFIVKFNQLDKIRQLEFIDDFERCLAEPVAQRPDDVLEGVLIRFLSNLKPGLRNLDCTNIQHHLSNYITDMLQTSTEFTVWDRPWAPNEEPRASCCNSNPNRQELGRLQHAGASATERVAKNPIRQMEDKGGGLFELDWRERARLLRQMVDWQLSHCEQVRASIAREFKVGENRGVKKALYVGDSETHVAIAPLGQDRDKNRIWAFDNSGRLYKSGNPYKRPCPLYAISSGRAEMHELFDQYTAHGGQAAPKVKGTGPKGKATAAESTAFKKLIRGIEDEKTLATKVEELLPLVEKEDARIKRAKLKVIAALELAQQAEMRSTRTRRPTRKVDYTYDESDHENDFTSKRRRGEQADNDGLSTARGKPFIPGERRSARQSGRDREHPNGESSVHGDTESRSSVPPVDTRDQSPATAPPLSAVINGTAVSKTRISKGMKGYAWVEEIVPSGRKEPHGQEAAGNAEAEQGDFDTPMQESKGYGNGDKEDVIMQRELDASSQTSNALSTPGDDGSRSMQVDQ